jgi:hypothetical protein
MRARTLALVWLVIGIALWCGFFDLYIARGADEYLRLHANYEMHRAAADPSMAEMMARAKRHGAVAASLWAGIVMVAGWGTIWLRSGSRVRHGGRGGL